ncbi:hypothetical protein ACQP2P_36240 [Dactylosporangium sp. CA-139114]|uniref:hypothetical protein n=1 Tax=Dactylosporangium sp. CA-139114 TaxID=3239931 RepID=UPI003D965069
MVLRARLAVLLLVSAAVSALLQAGWPPLESVAIVLFATAGGVEIGCRLTGTVPAMKIRVVVVVLVVTTVLSAVTAGYPAIACIGLVLFTAGCAVEIGRRLTGEPYQRLRWFSPGLA